MPISRDDFVAAFQKKKASKPTRKLMGSSDRRKAKSKMEKTSDPLSARKTLSELAETDSTFAGELVAYKLSKHEQGSTKWAKYLLAMDPDLWTDEHWSAFQDGDFDWVDSSLAAGLLDVMGRLPEEDQLEMLGRKGGDLLTRLEGNANHATMVKLVADRPDALADAIGVDRQLVTDVRDRLAADPFDQDAARAAVARLEKAHQAFARLLLVGDLQSKEGDATAWTRTFVAESDLWGNFGFQVPQIAQKGNFDWITKADAKKLCEIFRAQKGGPRVAWLQNPSFLQNLERADPKAFAELREGVPQLRAVYAARDATDGTTHVKGSAEHLAEVADALVAQVLSTDEGAPLAGFSYLADANREGRTDVNDWLSGVVDGETGGPCSVLTNVVSNLAMTWPGPGRLRIGIGEIVPPVLTRPLSEIDPKGRGMVTRGFKGKGNVFENGSNTGQVFFSGGGTGAAHTWVTLNDVPYDTLFDTKGDAVAGAVDEKFDQDDKDPDVYVGKTTGRRLIRDKKLPKPGEAMGFASYRLEPPKKKK